MGMIMTLLRYYTDKAWSLHTEILKKDLIAAIAR